MDVRTYRASSMQEALALVRRELGPEASVLQQPIWREDPLEYFIGIERRSDCQWTCSWEFRSPGSSYRN